MEKDREHVKVNRGHVKVNREHVKVNRSIDRFVFIRDKQISSRQVSGRHRAEISRGLTRKVSGRRLIILLYHFSRRDSPSAPDNEGGQKKERATGIEWLGVFFARDT
ncbi:hypothetical protein PoB_007427200 [Plakobranchus ocellatus]|uniref:Uncharacterized protein n=1 Tax=Plakobranchus ocellatus TaxID=259542 RepID=A0AAV4DUR7_9GAST|nr:hypothetical protein PoB_007427200 [Plakobranchus ocellatus]